MNEKADNNITVQIAYLESITLNELAGKKAYPGLFKRCNIHIHHKRKRLADTGGCSHKACIDGLVKAGVFKDDSAKYIKEISETQEKTDKDETIIVINEIRI